MFWGVGAEFVMGGVVQVGSAVCLESIMGAVRRDRYEEGMDVCGLGCGW
jgi:hypothetical protein